MTKSLIHVTIRSLFQAIGHRISMSHIHPSQTDSNTNENLKLLRECPLCQAAYKIEAMSVITEVDESRLVHMTCHECAAAVLAIVIASPLGMSSIGLVTDLTAKDVKRLYQKDVFTQDDVLAFHSGMQKPGGLESMLVKDKKLSKTFS